MAFLRAPLPDDYLAPIRGQSLILRPPTPGDYAAWAELRALSRAHLMPWEPAWSQDDLSRLMFRRRLRAYARDVRDDLAYAFFIADIATDTLLGGITLSNVRRGASQSASLGYWLGHPHVGHGRMTEAVHTLLPFAYATLRLNRVEAACMPSNTASLRVLNRTGFRQEGIARAYLKIAGKWQDHFMFSRLADDDRSSVSERF